MNYLDPVAYSKSILALMEDEMPEVQDVVPVKGEKTMKQRIQELTEEEKTKLKQYTDAIKEIKNEIYELLHKDKVQEGGNMSSDLTMQVEKEMPTEESKFKVRDFVKVITPINGENQRIPNNQEFDEDTIFEIIKIAPGYVVCRLSGERNYDFQMWAFDREEFENSVEDYYSM